MRNQLSAVLGVPPEKIRVIAEEVGGGFGVRFNLYPGILRRALRGEEARPPGEMDRHALGGVPRPTSRRAMSRTRGELALDAQGRILGMRFDMLSNLGAYLAPTGPFINTIGIVNCLSGVYDVPAAYARIRLALTNTAPMAAYRGAGRPVHVLRARAADRPRRARARHGPGRVPPPQLHSAGKFPVQDRCRLRIRLAAISQGVMDKALDSNGLE